MNFIVLPHNWELSQTRSPQPTAHLCHIIQPRGISRWRDVPFKFLLVVGWAVIRTGQLTMRRTVFTVHGSRTNAILIIGLFRPEVERRHFRFLRLLIILVALIIGMDQFAHTKETLRRLGKLQVVLAPKVFRTFLTPTQFLLFFIIIRSQRRLDRSLLAALPRCRIHGLNLVFPFPDLYLGLLA